MLVLDDVSPLWTMPLGGCALADEAFTSPAIVHFAGRMKPWRLTASSITGSRFRLPQVRFHSPGSPGHETC
jgi:lipopolysaccharide biosynthesis glycosyltransferase